ncbi:MAG: agmatinase family protein [Chitinophagales bacterium]
MKEYNPSNVGVKNGKIFGLPFNFDESEIVILPVPWEVTTSFGSGTSKASEKILEQSTQLDLYHLDFPNAWKKGIFMLNNSKEILELNKTYKAKAQEIIALLEKGKAQAELQQDIDKINEVSNKLNKWVFEQTTTLLNQNKKVILLGGDHSTPIGFLNALSLKHKNFGILQIDAHADLRNAYEGFTHSHASIMYNALKIKAVEKIVQVGVRDLCEEEVELINSDTRIECFYDKKIKQDLYSGKNYNQIIKEIIDALPQKVYISFDIDGLDPKLCPNTGTPVAGGLEYTQALEIIRQIKSSGKEIIACDLVEVGNADWDANVAARLLYEMACYL